MKTYGVGTDMLNCNVLSIKFSCRFKKGKEREFQLDLLLREVTLFSNYQKPLWIVNQIKINELPFPGLPSLYKPYPI